MSEIFNDETLTERETGQARLPKNIRQIGDARGESKVYIEDYVMTYIRQLAACSSQKEEALLLYGRQEQIDGTSYYFVSGGLRVPGINSPMENTIFDKDSWKAAKEEGQQCFDSLSVLGWALLSMDEEFSSGYRVKATQEAFFGRRKVFIEYSAAQKEEQVYLYQNGMMKRQEGHYIYYERNEAMQSYLISRRETRQGEDEEQLDHATRQFRRVAQGKKERKKKQRVNVLLYTTATVLALVVIMSGITMLNNYEKMQDMEEVLFQIADGTSTENEGGDEVQNLDERLREIEIASAQEEIGEEKAAAASDAALTQGLDDPDGTDKQAAAVQETLTADGAEDAAVQETLAADGAEDAAAKEAGGGDGAAQDGQTAPEGDAAQGDESQAVSSGRDAQTANPDDVSQSGAANGKDSAPQEGTGDAEGTQADSDAQQQAGDGETADTAAADQGTADAVSAQDDAAGQAVEASAQTGYQTYIIKKGDTLAKISYAFYGNQNRVDEICRINHIENKNNIRYGVKILLPQ